MSADKPFPPSEKKLRDARKKGEIPKSAQVTATAVFAGVLLTLLLALPWMLGELNGLWKAALLAIDEGRHAGAWRELGERAWWLVLWVSAPLLGACILSAIAGGWSQTRGLIAFEAVSPKFEKLNPAQNLKNIFSLKQFFDLLKKLLEMVVLGALIFLVLRSSIGTLLNGVYVEPIATAALGGRLLYMLFVAAAIFWVAVSALDYAIQHFGFMRQQRMNFEEVMREYKDMEGDPHMKAQRRALQQEAARGGGLGQARALVMNPTHVAVALAYDKQRDGLPSVVAKGLDQEALAMRRQAEALGIAVFEDVALARRLHAEVPLNQAISEPFFEPVARILVWVEQLAGSTAADAPGRVRPASPR